MHACVLCNAPHALHFSSLINPEKKGLSVHLRLSRSSYFWMPAHTTRLGSALLLGCLLAGFHCPTTTPRPRLRSCALMMRCARVRCIVFLLEFVGQLVTRVDGALHAVLGNGAQANQTCKKGKGKRGDQKGTPQGKARQGKEKKESQVREYYTITQMTQHTHKRLVVLRRSCRHWERRGRQCRV